MPTVSEAGVPDMVLSLWTGVVAPAGTPVEIIARLQGAIADTLAMPSVQSGLANIAVDARSTTSEEYRTLIARDAARWKAVATAANIKLE